MIEFLLGFLFGILLCEVVERVVAIVKDLREQQYWNNQRVDCGLKTKPLTVNWRN